MLSTKTITNARVAAKYYTSQDNYYTKGCDDAKENSQWWGKGAAKLGLQGRIEVSEFETILSGRLPNGELQGANIDTKNTKLKRRYGFDLTFSVPKSVSIAALLGNDIRLKKAAEESAKTALDYVEKNFAQARIKTNGNIEFINTGNLLGALFTHDLSFDGDPQLHIHSVIVSATELNDGKWRCLASQSGYYGKNAKRQINGFIEQVRHYKKYLGEIFRAELAYKAKQLGYELEVKKNGQFEIKGISELSKKIYSQRRQQIEKVMEQYGISGAKAAAYITAKTRKVRNVNRNTIREFWQAKSERGGIDAFAEAKKVVEQSKKNLKNSSLPYSGKIDNQYIPKTEQIRAREAIQYALNHLSETCVELSELDILNQAVKYTVNSNVNLSLLTEAFNAFIQSGELIPLNHGSNNDSNIFAVKTFTTKALVNYERSVLKAAMEKSAEKLISDDKLNTYLSQNNINKRQKRIVELFAEVDNTIVGLNGVSNDEKNDEKHDEKHDEKNDEKNDEKTEILKSLAELAKEDGYEIIILSPNKAASEALKRQVEIKPKTIREFFSKIWNSNHYNSIQSFVSKQEWLLEHNKENTCKKLIIVNEAQELSTKQLYNLQQVAGKINGRLVLSGDSNAPLSLQSGSPYEQCIKHGMNTLEIIPVSIESAKLSNIKQKIDRPTRDTLASNIEAALSKVERRILSISDKDECFEQMSHHYANLLPEERQNTLLLMQSNAQCEKVNSIVHELLKENGTLQVAQKAQQNIEVLLPVFINNADFELANSYTKGQVVRFNDNYFFKKESLKVTRGDYLSIIDVHKRNNIVVLMNENNKQILWNPRKVAGRKRGAIEVFKQEIREINIGEKLTWKRNYPVKNIHKSERLTVIDIKYGKKNGKKNGKKTQKLILERENTNRVTVNLKYNTAHHFDYGYAITPYQSRHIKTNQLIAYQNAYSRQSHQRECYKILSQVGKHAWIYTEDQQILLKNIKKQTGDKVTAINSLLTAHAMQIQNIAQSENKNIQNEHITLLEEAIEKALVKANTTFNGEKTPKELAKEAVQYALSHLSAREAAFEHKEVMKAALFYSVGNVNNEMITEAVLNAEKEGNLIRGVYSRDGTKWTTREAIEIELNIIEMVNKDKNILEPVASKEEIKSHIAKTKPVESHIEAIKAISTSTDRSIVVQGKPGTGKTSLLINLKQLLHKKGYKLLCLAPTHTAVKELKARGLESQTLASFIGENRVIDVSDEQQNQPGNNNANEQNEKNKTNEKLFIVLDENSMTSNQAGYDFLKIVHEKEARTIFMGDNKQLPAIESGKPHYLSMVTGAKTIYLDTILRQKNKDLLNAANLAYQNNYSAAFTILNDSIIEVGKERINGKSFDNQFARLEAIRDNYLSKSPEDRAKILIITFGNNERILQNALIREGLKEEGSLHGTTMVTDILVQRDMTEVERSKVQNYLIGDKVRFGYTDKKLGIEKNEYLTVTDIDKKHNLLTLEKEDGDNIVWYPKKVYGDDTGIEVYSREQRGLMTGDLIRWTRSNKELGLLSPELAKIEQVSNSKIVLSHAKITENGIETDNELTTINPKDQAYQHWDYAYAITSYSSQAKTIDEAIINAESYHKFLTSQRTMLVAITRAVNKLTIYTNNKFKLIEQLGINPGDKTSALETTGELASYTANQHQSQVKEKEKQKQPSSATKAPHKNTYIDANQVISHLNNNAQVMVTRILGEPKSREKDDFRYSYSEVFGGEDGKRDGGSLYVAVSGSKQGSWHCFKNGMGGRNLLSLIQHKYSLDFKQSLEYAVNLLGMSKDQFQTIGLNKQAMTRNSSNASAEFSSKLTSKYLPENWSEKQQKSVRYARKLMRESVVIKGTLAEKYLREHRGISAKLPKSFRFHQKVYSGINGASRPALLVIGENKDGKVQSAQAIFLDEKTANKAEGLKVKKQTWGVAAGAPATIGIKNGTKDFTFVAEGPETAMSILEAFPDSQVKVTFGKSSFRHVYHAESAKNIILCLDNDVDNSSTEMLTKTAAETLEKVGKKVWIAKPEEAGKDYNDLIKEQGTDAIRRNVEQAIPYKFYAKNEPANTNLYREVLHKSQQDKQESNKELDKKVEKKVEEKVEKTAQQPAYLTKEQNQIIESLGQIFTDEKLKNIEHGSSLGDSFGDIFEVRKNFRTMDISNSDINNFVSSLNQQSEREQIKIDRELQKVANKEKDLERET